jgi:hypothetical protein
MHAPSVAHTLNEKCSHRSDVASQVDAEFHPCFSALIAKRIKSQAKLSPNFQHQRRSILLNRCHCCLVLVDGGDIIN